ncbi:putative phage head-tail connector protein (P21) [Gammaproteobacteria bacterium]
MDANEHKRLHQRLARLKNERSSWDSHWKELSDLILPRSGRFFADDRDRGEKRHNNIYDSTATRAVRVLAAGMMSGMTSPARPWFKLGTVDQGLQKFGPVKLWLDDVTRIMLAIFQRSNTYRTLHSMYEELAVFGTSASLIASDYENVIHHFPLTIGSYCIATNYKGEVTTVYREFQKTVYEIIEEFGIDQVSATVKGLYDRGSYDEWVTIIHAIEPRAVRDPSKLDDKSMAWRSIFFEVGAPPDKYLRESGFKRFPVLCPRWSVSGEDIYGSCPGMEALGDIRQLQAQQIAKGKIIALQADPPIQLPTSAKHGSINLLPGGISFIDSPGQGPTARNVIDSRADLNHLVLDIQETQRRVESMFYVDVFLMISGQVINNMTATEVAERHEEKLLLLGPVLERLQNELLNPLIEITFDKIMEAGIAPPIPQELRGTGLNIELVSMISQAQRAVGSNSIFRLLSVVEGAARIDNGVVDKINFDRLIDVYAEDSGIPPALIESDENVQLKRQQRAQAQQAANQAAITNQGADTVQKLAAAKTVEPNALSNIIGSLSGGRQ